MVDLDKLRSDMKFFLDTERRKKSIYLSGDDLDEILREASVQLSAPIRKLSYEVLHQGCKGFFGFGASKWNILVYRDERESGAVLSAGVDQEPSGGEEEVVIDRDGEFFVRSTSEILLKVTPPKGQGNCVKLEDIISHLEDKGITGYQGSSIRRILKESKGVYLPIASRRSFDPSQNPIMSIERDSEGMNAFLTLSAPGENGAEVMEGDIITMLHRQGISDKAILHEAISCLVDKPVYGEPVLVARGLPPVDGTEGSIHYFYKNEKETKFKESRTGQIDFKEISLIQNVKKGDILAEKIPPKEGVEGYDLDGHYLAPKRKEEVQFTVGNNVEVSSDGSKLLATCDGYVIFKDRILNVENVYLIDGDVGPKTGNIYNNGAVLVKGSIMDGYTVEVMGNLEILGSVGRSKIISKGDVILHLGINGNHDAFIKASGNVWAKFIENSYVTAGKSIFVSDGILYSEVGAGEDIICQGKRAKIVGGRIIARQEVTSVDLGALGSGETIVEVGFKPEDLKALGEINEWRAQLDEELNELTKNIQTADKQVRRGDTQSPLGSESAGKEKQKLLPILRKEFDVMSRERALVGKEIEDLQLKLNEGKVEGRINVSRTAHPGVTLRVNGISYELIHEMSRVTFLADEDKVKAIPYDSPGIDIRSDRPTVGQNI